MSKHKTYTHEIKAYAAFSNRGALLYATIKPSKDEAQAAYERFNPEVSQGYFEILPIFIGIDKGYQYDLEEQC